MADQVVLPDDQEQFKLNEVCKVANVQPYMLRFWGSEFPQLEAATSGTGQRLYSRDQVELILEIRRLLFDEGLTIAGARKKIAAADDGGAKMGEGSPRPPPPRKSTPTRNRKKRRLPRGPAARAESPRRRQPPRLTRRPRPTYNHFSRRSRTFATRSTKS
jgi:DNA-binding transcriptional MerR regulator